MHKLERLAVVGAIAFGFWVLVSQSADAQSAKMVPRWSGSQPYSLTTSAPTASPWPESTSFTCDGCQGQSTSVPGALHLATCGGYRINCCADAGSVPSNLNGSGTVQVFSFPEYPKSGANNQWAQNAQLTETITNSGVACQTFAGHIADGLGWIAPVPTKVTTLQPNDAGFDAGVVNCQVEATCLF